MEPIKIEVSVSIGMDSALLSALTSLLNRAAVPVAPAARPTEVPAPQTAAAPVQVEEPAPVEAAPAAPAPQPAQPDPATKEYTEVDVRAAMDRTRKRIEGENYKEKTDSEGYKKWHRVLTGWFKNTAAMFGAEKPSALPDSESRAKFIACCDAVYVKGDELVEDCPF